MRNLRDLMQMHATVVFDKLRSLFFSECSGYFSAAIFVPNSMAKLITIVNITVTRIGVILYYGVETNKFYILPCSNAYPIFEVANQPRLQVLPRYCMKKIATKTLKFLINRYSDVRL